MRARVRAVPSALVAALTLASVPLLGASAGALAGGSLAGTVTGEDGRPLAGVCVDAVESGEFGDFFVAETDKSGSYEVTDLPAGDYVVGFNTCFERKPGFAPEWFDDAPSFDLATPVTVSASSARTGIDAALAPTGTISGRVTDQDSGAGLGDICVLTFDDTTGGFGEATTGANGSYRLEDVAPGEHVVLFVDCAAPQVHLTEAYDDVQVEDLEAGQEPTAVTVVSDADTAGIDAALEQGGAVTGVVTALHTGREQPLVCVGLYAADGDGEPEAGTVTGASPFGPQESSPGSYTGGPVRPGRYVVGFNPDVCGDDGYATSWYDGERLRADATVLTVTKGAVNDGIDAVVAPLPSTSFVCPGDEGQPSRFPDVPADSVHRVALECMADFGVVQGRSDGSYGPAEPVRRGQLATFAARVLEAAGVTLPASPADAYDDDNGHTHEEAINQLAELGVLAGKGARRFAPDDTVERGQLATVLVATYEEATGFALRAADDRFTDDEGTTHEANTNKASVAGLAAGTGGSSYTPRGLVRRDQVASFLARALDRVQRDQVGSFTGESGTAGGAAVRPSAAGPGEGTAGLQRLARDAAAALRD